MKSSIITVTYNSAKTLGRTLESGGIIIGDNVIMGQYVSFHSENYNFTSSKKLIRVQGVTNKGIVLYHH